MMEDSGSPILPDLRVKEVELKQVQSDLHALRKLYGFLQSSRDVGQNARNEILDEEAWLLLKNLLDGATEKVLKTYSMIIAAAGPSVHNTPFSSKSEQERAVPVLQPSVLPSTLNAASALTQNSFKDSDCHSLSSQKDDYSPNKLATQAVVPELPTVSISTVKPKTRKKICRGCKQINKKQQSSTIVSSKDGSHHHQQHDIRGPFHQVCMNTRNLLDGKERRVQLGENDENIRQRKVCRHHGIPSTLNSVACSSRSPAPMVFESRTGNSLVDEVEKKEMALSSFCKDVENAIKEIEPHISALQLCSELVADAESSPIPHTSQILPSSVSPTIQTHNWELSTKSGLGRGSLSNQQTQRFRKNENSNRLHQLSGQDQNDSYPERWIPQKQNSQFHKHFLTSDVRQNQERREILSQVGSQRYHTPTESSPYVHGLRVPVSHDFVSKKPPLPSKMPNSSHNHGKELMEKVVKLRSTSPSPSPSVGSKASVRLSHKKGLPHQTLLDYKPTKEVDGSRKFTRNKIVPHLQESEVSSSWTSQESSTGRSDSETYSLPSPKSSRKGSSDSEAYSLPSPKSSRKGSSNSEAYSLESPKSSKKFADLARQSSAGDSNNPYSDDMDVSQGSSHRLGPTRSYKAVQLAKSEKPIGRLRRFKNKLGLIFHHHHHHHHHHHDVESDGGMWKHLRNIFHGKSKAEVHKNKVADKLRKSVVVRKQQVGHFHALVEGLMQHIRHSKKSKPSRNGIGLLKKSGDKKAVKKLQWWRMLQQHHGTKPPNRGRVKIGLMNKKRQLTAAKLS